MDTARFLVSIRGAALFTAIVSGVVIGLDLRRHGVAKGVLAPEWRNYLGPYRALRTRMRRHLLWYYSYIAGLAVFMATLVVQWALRR